MAGKAGKGGGAGGGKAKIYYTALCNVHGNMNKSGVQNMKDIRVPIPSGKQSRRFGGCPICKGQ